MKWYCTVCGYVYEGPEAPEACPVCKAPKEKFKQMDEEASFATVHEVGVAQGVSTKKNLQMRVDAETGACEGKFDLAKRAKAQNLDAIHDTVHEMAKDEARHGAGFRGLLNRYFK